MSAALLMVGLLPQPAVSQQDSEGDAFNLARNLFRDADFATASELFAEFIRNHPTSDQLVEGRLLLARSYRGSGRCGQAIPVYEIFYREHPDNLQALEARQERAECLNRESRYLDAAKAYEEVRELFPHSPAAPSVLLAAAANYTAGSQHQQAVRVYRKLIQQYGQQVQANDARYHLARLLFATGDPASAQELLAKVATARNADSQAPSALLLSGQINLLLGNRPTAEKTFTQLQHRFPQSAQADSTYLALAKSLADKGHFSRSVAAYTTAHKKIASPNLKLRARLGLADALRKTGKAKEALAHYSALLKKRQPDHHDYNPIRLGLAIARGQTGEFTAAYNLFQTIIQSAPETAEALASFRELGALYHRRGDYNSAITWYNTYLDASGQATDRAKVKLSLARIYAKLGYYKQAIPLMRALAESGSEMAAAQFELATLLERTREPLRARGEFVAFLERFPSHPRAHTARDRVEYLNGFTVLDQVGYDEIYQRAHVDELSGTPRQIVLLETALALYEHHDIEQSTRLLETYVAQYPEDPFCSRAQYFLAEALGRLARQRRLEGRPEQADSLRLLALRERRILASQPQVDEWSLKATLQLIELDAEALPDSSRLQLAEAAYASFLQNQDQADDGLKAQALFQLAETQRLRALPAEIERLSEAASTFRRLLQEYPTSDRAVAGLYGLALCHAGLGEQQAAVDSLNRILRDFPGDRLTPKVLLQLGQLHFREGKRRAAASRFQELLLAYPAFPDRRAAQRQLADTHYELGEFAAAIGLYKRWLDGAEQGVERTRVECRLAASYRQRQEFEAALSTLQGALDQAPDAVADSISFDIAQLLAALGRREEAIAQYLRVEQQFITSPLAREAALDAAHLLFATERYDAALTTYRAHLDSTDDPKAHAQAVLSFFRLKRLKEARKAASRFAKQFSKDAFWWPQFALEEGQYHLSASETDRAIKKFELVESRGGQWSDEGAYQAATALWAANQTAPSQKTAVLAVDAQMSFVKNYADSPRAPEVHLRMGNYYKRLRRPLEAAAAYKRVVNSTVAPLEDRQTAIYYLFKSYRESNSYDEAHRILVQLLNEFPNHPKSREAQLELGAILGDIGQDAKAIAQLEKVLEWAQDDEAAEAQYRIGASYQNMGEYREAIRNYYRVSYYGAAASAMWITTADYKRGECHEILGEFDMAITVWEKIVRREGISNPLGSEAQKRIDDVRRRINAKTVR